MKSRNPRTMLRELRHLIMLLTWLRPANADCFDDPTICSVKPYETCSPCGATESGLPKHCCVVPPASPDCYKSPGTCGPDQWCELNDRKSWNDTDATTMGRCVPYQAVCQACTPTFQDDNPPVFAGVNAFAFLSQVESSKPSEPFGTYLSRETRCGAGLICTGDLIPSLPPTCVYQRKLPAATPRKVGPSAAQMREWGLRLMRMGARNQQGAGPSDPKQQLAQGVMRQDM